MTENVRLLVFREHLSLRAIFGCLREGFQRPTLSQAAADLMTASIFCYGIKVFAIRAAPLESLVACKEKDEIPAMLKTCDVSLAALLPQVTFTQG